MTAHHTLRASLKALPSGTAPAITTQPGTSGGPTLDPVTGRFTTPQTVAASGSPAPSCQWQVAAYSPVGSYADIPGATNPTAYDGTGSIFSGSPSAAAVRYFRAVFTNTYGSATTTVVAVGFYDDGS